MPTQRERILEKSKHRCGYCQAPGFLLYAALRVDHIMPSAHGGTNDDENLWASCDPCNAHKSAIFEAQDPETHQIVPLFNPQTQNWHAHFRWAEDGATIVGISAIGRATVITLKLNDLLVLELRKLWVGAGWYPPNT